ncbi:MAG: ribosomal RNA small subunit methyltransferase A [Proteobacteria bacterium]|nr:ribosomal RNA small subunit methyltransferase A [Pseudomonadota bacterium]
MRSPRTLLAAQNIRPKKELGQNFLADPSTATMIVGRSVISPEDIVLEIGAGLGALTIPVARIAQKVYAVEIDPRIIDILKTQLLANHISNVVIVDRNILKIDIQALVESPRRKIVVMGNLPYNISSQVLVRLIKSRNIISRAVLMFQKELAQRITAHSGCKDYGRLTVMMQYCADTKRIAEVNAALFFPKPKVDSQLLEFRFKTALKYTADDETFFFSVIKAAFGNRRKTLKNALATSELNIDAATAQNVLERSGINPVRRAETLEVEEFVRLSNNLQQQIPLIHT